jgi:hypothetical protein
VPVLEPVQVLARERGGRSHYLVWNGDALGEPCRPAAREVPLSPVTPSADHRPPAAGRHVDPRSRLTETPRRRRPTSTRCSTTAAGQSRFVYSGIGFEISAAEFAGRETASARLQALSGRVLFEGSQRRDLRRTGHLQFQRDREASAAVGGGASIWLGDKVNRRRRRARIRLFADLQWLNANGLDQSAGVRITQTAALIDDTRKFGLWPDRGRRLAFALSGGQTIRIGGPRGAAALA